MHFTRIGSVSLPLTALADVSELTYAELSLESSTGAAVGSVSVQIRFEMDSVGFAFPNPVAATAALALDQSAPSDATPFELRRDALMSVLLHHPCIKVLTACFVIGVSCFIGFLLVLFPMQVGSPAHASPPTRTRPV